MFDINLVPEIQQQKQSLAKKNTYATIFGVSVVGAVVAVLVIIGSVKVGASISLSNTEEKISAVREESKQYKELEEAVLSLENGLVGAKQTLDGQNNWTILLPHLEKATPNDVQFKNLKIEGTGITAQLKGKSVDSIARFIQSYKSYQVVVLKGTGSPQENIKISLNNAPIGETKVKSTGDWVYALRIDPLNNQEISANGESSSKVSYFANTREIKVTEGSVSTSVANLFSTVETKQYTKEGSNVSFDSTITVLTEALW